jgi:glyoxylase-like metal-dependent hydrolase (beta-lactamase superfamily II)/rhodanese-related sulfurtransferase
MYFQRYYLGCLAHASYMIADEETKIAAVIDPQRDIDQYLEDAAKHGFTIRYVFLTHFHADFVAGHIELRDKLGAHIYIGAKGKAEFDATPVKDGDVVEFGNIRFSILETPGHTPESISVVVYDLQESDRIPHAVLTGDALFIGDVGRPDLLGSIGFTADELADQLYDSLHNKLLKLPDETLIYPAHGAGSLCGKQLGTEETSTIANQRRYNYALQPMTKNDFKKMITAEQPEAPDYFVHDAILNRQERDTLQHSMQESLKPLDLNEVAKLQGAGAQIVDTRDTADFAGSHFRGSINISLGGWYASWVGTLLDKTKPIVVIAEPGREEESIMRLGRIGFDQVAGYLDHGVKALDSRPDLLGVTNRVTAKSLAEWLQLADAPFVLDVRTEKEVIENRIEGSVNIPLNHVVQRKDELPTDRQIVVLCGSGYRSSIAASLLAREGVKDVFDLVGGIQGWKATKLPTVEGASSAA